MCPDSQLRGAEAQLAKAPVRTLLAHGTKLQGGGLVSASTGHGSWDAGQLSSFSSSVLVALILGRWVFFSSGMAAQSFRLSF